MSRVTRGLGITKKRFLEEAIRRHARTLSAGSENDVWSDTLGAWNRKERFAKTASVARQAFRKSFERHHRGRDAGLHR